jgi:GNAT superfamily N-acetyltransferase
LPQSRAPTARYKVAQGNALGKEKPRVVFPGRCPGLPCAAPLALGFRHSAKLMALPSHQRKGLGYKLWSELKQLAEKSGNDQEFTVNSSLIAVSFYASFGFKSVGEALVKNGIRFQPMVLLVRTNAVRYISTL